MQLSGLRRFIENVWQTLVCGDPAIELPRLARSLRAGLIVMGAVSRSGLKRIFIGNTIL